MSDIILKKNSDDTNFPTLKKGADFPITFQFLWSKPCIFWSRDALIRPIWTKRMAFM